MNSSSHFASRHNILALGLFTWLLFAAVGMGQIRVGCELKYDRTLLYEPVMLDVQIANETGIPLIFDGPDANARLRFIVSYEFRDPMVPRRDAPPIPLEIAPLQRIRKRIQLQQQYDLRKTGAYTIQASINWRGRAFISPKCYLDILKGSEVQQTFGETVPNNSFRYITLLSLYRSREQHLLLKIEDDNRSVCYGVFNLGSYVPLQAPELYIGPDGLVYVEHRSGPSQFTRTLVDGNGKVIEQDAILSPDAGTSPMPDMPAGLQRRR